MKVVTAVAVGLLMVLPLTGAAAEEQAAVKPGDETSVPLGDLVARVHKKTGKDFILDPSTAATRISLAGMDPARIDYPMLMAVLRYQGLMAVSILPDRDARQLPSRVLNADDAKIGDDTLVTRVVQVRSACAAHMVPVLRPLMPQFAHMAAYPPTNTLILADRADNVRRLVDLIESIDKTAPARLDCGESAKLGS